MIICLFLGFVVAIGVLGPNALTIQPSVLSFLLKLEPVSLLHFWAMLDDLWESRIFCIRPIVRKLLRNRWMGVMLVEACLGYRCPGCFTPRLTCYKYYYF